MANPGEPHDGDTNKMKGPAADAGRYLRIHESQRLTSLCIEAAALNRQGKDFQNKIKGKGHNFTGETQTATNRTVSRLTNSGKRN